MEYDRTKHPKNLFNSMTKRLFEVGKASSEENCFSKIINQINVVSYSFDKHCISNNVNNIANDLARVYFVWTK